MSDSALFNDSRSCQRWQAPPVSPDHGHSSRHEAVEQKRVEESERAEGYEAGYRQGLAAAQQEIHSVTKRLESIMEALAEPLAAINETVECQLVELAIAVARQLIRRELKLNPGEIVPIVREAVALLPAGENKVYIYLHPEDARLIHDTLSIDEVRSCWTIQEDAGISRGGCHVTSGHAQVDATVETRMMEVVSRLLGGQRAGDHGA